MPKIGKIKWGKFSNFTNRITIISQTELQTEITKLDEQISSLAKNTATERAAYNKAMDTPPPRGVGTSVSPGKSSKTQKEFLWNDFPLPA